MELMMIEDRARDDIAFIRHAVEEGRNYATVSSPDIVIWGIAVAVGYLGTYAFVRGWSPVRPSWVWGLCIGLPWVYSLRRLLPAFAQCRADSPMARALSMLWLGCGVFLTTLAVVPRSGPVKSARAGLMPSSPAFWVSPSS
jgi:hypothetical protein